MRTTKAMHSICTAITAAFIVVSVFVFNRAYFRLYEGCRDIGLSAAFYFCRLFGIELGINPTVNQYPGVPPWGIGSGDGIVIIPDNWSAFAAKMSVYGRKLFSGSNLSQYFSAVGGFLGGFCKVLLFVIPIVILVKIMFSRYLKHENNRYNQDTFFLTVWKKLSNILYWPAKRWVLSFVSFVREYKAYWVMWLCIWLFNFNAVTVLVEAIAYYLYFAVSFDILSLYRQVYKLFLDSAVVVRFVPWWAWPIVVLCVWNYMMKKAALRRLNRNERANRRFIESLPIVFMVVGKMGMKKTTLMTDMALSQDVIFRDKALELLLENDLKFPQFPWIELELELRAAMEHGQVYHLASCRKFVRKKAGRWAKNQTREKLFGYDYERYGYDYENGLNVSTVWEIVETYAQLYFIYVIQSSLLITNYAIREDAVLQDLGNFPMWHADFFESDPRLMDAYSRHSHILDFDMLRLGKKIVRENQASGAFEFGCVVLTESGKERGNMIETQGMKRDSAETNQKNDLFNLWLKMIRHSGTVDNYPFVRVMMDEQRPESMGADVRELCQIVHIEDCSPARLARPYLLGEILHDWLYGRFQDFYRQIRYLRGDNTLLVHWVKTLVSVTHGRYRRVYNRFGYYDLSLAVEEGTQDSPKQVENYKLAFKKAYARRFSTDCFSDYFAKRSEGLANGLAGLPEYESERATFGELLEQNSYFINDLLDPEWRVKRWPPEEKKRG